AEACLADLSNGGRGIRYQIEAHLVNPVSRALFAADARPGSHYTIAALIPGEVITVLLEPHARRAPPQATHEHAIIIATSFSDYGAGPGQARWRLAPGLLLALPGLHLRRYLGQGPRADDCCQRVPDAAAVAAGGRWRDRLRRRALRAAAGPARPPGGHPRR